jgi:nucleoid-associated protein YgaU
LAWAAMGDANLDGAVDTADLNALLTGVRLHVDRIDAGWQHGDFDYDQRVSTADLSRLVTGGLLRTGPYQPPANAASTVTAASMAEPPVFVRVEMPEMEAKSPRPAFSAAARSIDRRLHAFAAFGRDDRAASLLETISEPTEATARAGRPRRIRR